VEAIEGASSMEPGLANSESVHSGKWWKKNSSWNKTVSFVIIQ
jgi:hypothetical protein